jgi:hypothetical protein
MERSTQSGDGSHEANQAIVERMAAPAVADMEPAHWDRENRRNRYLGLGAIQAFVWLLVGRKVGPTAVQPKMSIGQ